MIDRCMHSRDHSGRGDAVGHVHRMAQRVPRRRSVWCCFAGYRCTLGSSVRRICRCIVYRRVCRPVLTSAMASFPCRSASVRPACPLTNVSHYSSAEQDEYAGLWVMPLRLLNADFRFWSRFRGGFLPSRVLGWSTTTTMVRVTRYKEWNFICRRCLEPMVFEDWPIGI